MARPPFEPTIFQPPARPSAPQETETGKVVPVPNAQAPCSSSPSPYPSPSRVGVVTKFLMAIGVAGGMLGIGAFLGVVVIWMSRIELTSRVPPSGTPMEASRACPPGGLHLPTDGRSYHPKVEFQKPTQKTSSLGSAKLEAPWTDGRERTEILLEMKLVGLDPSATSEANLQSLPSSARGLLEAFRLAGPFSSSEEPVLTSGRESSQSAPEQKLEQASAERAASAGQKAPVAQLRSSKVQEQRGSEIPEENPSGEPLSEKSRPSSPPRSAEVPPSEHPLRKGGKNTLDFQQPQGIRPHQLLDSPTSEPADSKQHSEPPSSGSAKPKLSGSPSSSSAASGKSEASASSGNKASGSSPEPFSLFVPSSQNGDSDESMVVLNIDSERLTKQLEVLVRRGIVRELGSAKLALQHRWPTQLELIGLSGGPGAALRNGTSQEATGSRKPSTWSSSGKLHCWAQVETEDQIQLEVVALCEAIGIHPIRSPQPDKPLGLQRQTPFSNHQEDKEAVAQGADRFQSPKLASCPPTVRWYRWAKRRCPVGKWLLLAGQPTEEPGGIPPGKAYLLVRAKVQKPPEPLAHLPLSESELRERSVAQCRYLEAVLQAQFPNSQIQLSLAAGKIFVHGQAETCRQMEEILTFVRRRAVHQWKIHSPLIGQRISSPDQQADDAAVVNMLQLRPVRLRVQLVQLAHQLTDSAESGAKSGRSWLSGLSSPTRAWVQSLAEAVHRQQAVVLATLSTPHWQELQSRKLARILCQPQVLTASGQKETIHLGSPSETSGQPQGSACAEPSKPPGSPKGTASSSCSGPQSNQKSDSFQKDSPSAPAPPAELLVEIVPEVISPKGLRLEVVPTIRRKLSEPTKAQPGLLSQGHSWHVQALLEPGQVLVIPIAVSEADRPEELANAKPTDLGSPTGPRVLLVWADSLWAPPQSPKEHSLTAEGISDRFGSEGAQSNSGKLSSTDTNSRGQTTLTGRKAQQASYEESLANPWPPHQTKDFRFSSSSSGAGGENPSVSEALNHQARSGPHGTEKAEPSHQTPSTGSQSGRTEPIVVRLARLAETGQLVLPRGNRVVLQADAEILRIRLADPAVAELHRISPHRWTLQTKAEGTTQATVWFVPPDQKPVHFQLRVLPAEPSGLQDRIVVLEEVLASLFPRSKVRLRWEANRLIVEGEAPNAPEASQILAVVRAEALPADPSQPLRLINRLRLALQGPVQYLLRVRFVVVDPLVLRQSAEKVKRSFPHLVPLAGTLLEGAEQSGHLVLEASQTEQLPELLRQAEQMGLVRVLAQPTFGVVPGRSAEYLLPFGAPNIPHQGENTKRGDAPVGYLLWQCLPEWTKQGQWHLEIILQQGGSLVNPPEGRSRLVATLELGETSVAGIPVEYWPGPLRLVVLTTPEIRDLPPPHSTFAESSPQGIKNNSPISPPSRSHSPNPSGDETSQTLRASSGSGILSRLGQFFRAKRSQSNSSAAGYTIAESADLPQNNSLEITVPEAPLPSSSPRPILPRVVRPRAPQ